jgi:hypothetical protein
MSHPAFLFDTKPLHAGTVEGVFRLQRQEKVGQKDIDLLTFSYKIIKNDYLHM